MCIRDRAKKRLEDGSYLNGGLEAKAFSVYNRIRKKFTTVADKPRSWVDPGHKTGTAGNERSKAKTVMTDATRG